MKVSGILRVKGNTLYTVTSTEPLADNCATFCGAGTSWDWACSEPLTANNAASTRGRMKCCKVCSHR